MLVRTPSVGSINIVQQNRCVPAIPAVLWVPPFQSFGFPTQPMMRPFLVQQPLIVHPPVLATQPVMVHQPVMMHQPVMVHQRVILQPTTATHWEQPAPPLHREVQMQQVRVNPWSTLPTPSKRRPASGGSARVAGGFKVLDTDGEQARSDLFYGRFSPSPLTKHDYTSPKQIARELFHSTSSPSLRRSRSKGSLFHGRLKKTLDDRMSSRPTSRERYLPAAYTASLSSSRSLEDLTNPAEFPGTEFGRLRERESFVRGAESPF